jgi:hypothetical protein
MMGCWERGEMGGRNYYKNEVKNERILVGKRADKN